MRYFLFKLFLRIASLFSDDKDWLKGELDRQRRLKICRDRQAEMDACIRPKTYPKVKGVTRYSDYYENQ